MKSWVIAIGLSVALHLGLVAMLGREVSVAPRAVEKTEVKGDVVSFTPVSVVSRAEPPAPARTPAARVSPSITKSRVVPQAVSAVSEAAEVGPSPLPLLPPNAVAPGGLGPLPQGEGDGGVNAGAEEGDSFVTEAVIVGPSPEVIALVHARLAAAAEGCYPPVARRFQQRGTVQLSFCTDASGGAASSTVTISSGAEVLDAAARGCVVEHASPFPAIAASRCFSVPVRFGAR